MEKLVLQPSKTNPFVCLDPSNKTYQITGKSFPEDAKEVFEPIFNWFQFNLSNIDHKIELEVQTDYFNSTSNRFLLKILRILERYNKAGKEIEIVWHFEDEEIQNNGIIFSHLVNLPFRFIYKPITEQLI